MELEDCYHQVNGITLHTVEAGDRRGNCMILLHGFPEGWYGWKEQILFFARKGYRVIVPDQRGYNRSSKPAGIRSYCLQHLVADIAALIRQVTDKKAVLAGHDWGGSVAWHLALHHAYLLSHLVIVNMPHPDVFKKTVRTKPAQMWRSNYAAFFQLPMLPEWVSRAFHFALLERSLLKTSNKGTFSREDITVYKEAWRQPGALTAMINWYRAYKHNSLTASGIIQMPALLIWGRKDRFLLSEMAQASIDRCLHGKLVMIDDATHWVLHEQPQVVNNLIDDFITTQQG